MSDQLRISAAFSILAMASLALFQPGTNRQTSPDGAAPVAAIAELPALDLPRPDLLPR